MVKDNFIGSLSPTERDVFADMIMRSLRGNWSRPEERTRILDTLADHEMEVYDDLQSKVDGYRSDAYSGRPYGDARYFRSYYGEVDITDVDEETVRLMASHIPHDLTWDSWRLDQEFGDE
jgi:hypothetical protein